MPRAYVMVMASAGMAPDLVEQIREVEGVVEAHVVAGDFDVVVELEADDAAGFLPLITTEIHNLEGVGTTKTYVALE